MLMMALKLCPGDISTGAEIFAWKPLSAAAEAVP
jgi:hypothetical protein